MRLQNLDGQRTFPADATREKPIATYTKQKEGAAINNQIIEASPKKICMLTNGVPSLALA
jgi:hypothetical protein